MDLRYKNESVFFLNLVLITSIQAFMSLFPHLSYKNLLNTCCLQKAVLGLGCRDASKIIHFCGQGFMGSYKTVQNKCKIL